MRLNRKSITAVICITTLSLVTAAAALSMYACGNNRNIEKNSKTTISTSSVPNLANADNSKYVDTDALNYTGKIQLNSSSIETDGKNITVDKAKNTATITAGGTYRVSGSLKEGGIVIDAADNKKVELVFANVEIENSADACIKVLNTKKLYIILENNSDNKITCTAAFNNDAESETSNPDAAIYSKEDLILKGNGSLTIKSSGNGITSKDSLEIYDGSYNITADNNGIKGKDNVYIENCNIVINSGNDGIKSTNSADASLGYVAVSKNADITITSEGDGISAETDVLISGGTISITSGGGSKNAQKASQNNFPFRGPYGSPANTSSSDTVSCKGIKAGNNITVDDGTISIDSADDSLHSNTNITINGGEYTISSGDDGVHADTLLTINGGDINIENSYEGLEASDIVINGGNISLNASDDGINAAGGNDNSQSGGMWGGDRFNMNGSGNNSITINGGYIYVNAAGDGLDSNGSITMTGGTVIVNGPTDNGNGALDYDRTFSYTGGTLIASGSSGMLQAPTASSSTVNSVCIVFNSTISAGSVVRIEDSAGNEVLTFSSPKNYNALVVGSDLLKTNSSYKIYVNGKYTGGTSKDGVYTGGKYEGTEYTDFTVSGTVTSVGFGGGINMPGGNFGGGGRQPGGDFGGNGGRQPGGDFGGRPGGR